MPHEIPQPVQQALDEYAALVQQTAPDLLVGLYLHGSLAFGAFNPGLSDIDFIAVTSRACAASDINALRHIHYTLEQHYPKMPFEGCYLQWQHVGLPDDVLPPHPHLHEGVLQVNGTHTMNEVMWWILKHHSVTVFGPPLDRDAISIDWNALIDKMHDNLNTYWASFTTQPQHIAWLLSDYGIQWAVLGVLRQFYSFREHAIVSKTDAGLYALNHLPVRWHRLIREAINLRRECVTSLYRFRLVRALEAHAFLHSIIAACNHSNKAH